MKRSFQNLPVTPSYERVRARFQSFTVGEEEADVGHLVLALLCEESLGGKCFADLGISVAGIAEGCFGERAADTATAIIEGNDAAISPVVPERNTDINTDLPADWFCRIHERAGFIARRSDVSTELSTEHLIQAMVEVTGPAQERLKEVGVAPHQVLRELHGESEKPEGLAVDFDLDLGEPRPRTKEPQQPAHNESTTRLFALLDANVNRAREGLRVLEDYVRFVVRDEATTQRIKSLRHDLVDAEVRLPTPDSLLANRDVEEDAGTSASTAREVDRGSIRDVVRANARRVQEALRSLEEFGKLVDSSFAMEMKQLRYRSYEAEQALLMPEDSPRVSATESSCSSGIQSTQDELADKRRERLQTARLYVLLSESNCLRSWKDVVQQALQGGADIIQLREKELPDEEIIKRGRWIAEACKEYEALFILNDRVDLVCESHADGVHLGQEDMSINAARQLLPPDRLIGISTHDGDQLKDACAAGADYLGVGPVMASTTKSFTEFAGLEFVDFASSNADRPWFAIGGISVGSIAKVAGSGAERIAVSAAVIGREDPTAAAAELKRRMTLSADAVDPSANFPRVAE